MRSLIICCSFVIVAGLALFVFADDITGGDPVDKSQPGQIHIDGKIDNAHVVTLTSTGDAVYIDGRIDGGASVVYWPADALVVDDSSGNRNHVVAQQW